MEQTFPTAVLWAAGICGFLGFFIGSIPPNDPDGGWSWDMQGALMWMIAAATVAGGVALWLTTGAMTPGLYGAAFGLAIAALRVGTTRPARVPVGKDMSDGIHRASGETAKARWKAARRMYNNASFADGNYYASRSPRDHSYGPEGMPSDDLSALRETLQYANSRTLAIVVLLVRELPNEPEQPAVVVVRGNFGRIQIDGDGITIADLAKLPARTIAGIVGYAWR